MIILTTCRRPTQRIRSFIRDIQISHPNTTLLARGKLGLGDLLATARRLSSDNILFVSRWMRGPGLIELLRVNPNIVSRSPTPYLNGVRLRRGYVVRRAPRAEIVTTSTSPSSETAKFARWYSQLFGMRLLEPDATGICKASIHITDHSKGVRVALRSPPTESDVGLSFTVGRID